ncbi:cell division protein FtsQ [Orrella sp. JC864]|uniref:alginate O-acetyltransferase AlgX-related protein n=1 Tax=Orrella sp. JC864 TaxID=3120298 RepID=UPI003009C955
MMRDPAATPPPSKPPMQQPTLFARLTSPLAGLGLACILAAGLLSNGYAWFVQGRAVLPEKPDWPGFMDGKITGAIAQDMGQAPLPAGLAKLQRAAGWLFMGDLGRQVRQGCPGWLFLAEELMPQPDGAAHAAARARTVTAVRERLQERGIALAVAIVPDKSRIAAAQLCRLARPASLAGRAADFAQALAAAGVPAVDLAPALAPLGAQAFLRTDTHWNEAGARQAARALGQALRQAGLAPERDREYEIQALAPAPRPGDLVRLAGLDWLAPSLQPAPEMAARSRLSLAPGAQPDGADDDLFGDAGLPRTVVVGSSYSRTSNFVPFLAAELGVEVANFGLDGGKFAGGANAYFASAAFRQTPPRLVIWEIPERDLQTPLDGEQVALP